ncbi:MAG TPA: FUSC family membrane protein [Flavisolibacter sp.]|nr:FUSC family membrane protein [Flavisolibacter sp.]
MQQKLREAPYFFFSQAFADGLRATVAIVLPALIGSYLGHFETGLTISMGAMVVSLTDAPGPLQHKTNGILAAAGFSFIVAILTALAQSNVYTLATEIVVVTFFFSMLTVYGTRASAVGNAAVLVMILTMDKAVPRNEIILHGLLIFAGGLFYLSFSMASYFIRPYRNAQRILGDCIREIATYLSIRADFYNVSTDLESDYKRMVAQQIIVNEKQDAVRELFFKTRQIAEESTVEGRKLTFTFIETVDLFEDITASYYDYRLLRQKFSDSGALALIHSSLKKIAGELNSIGIAIETDASFSKGFNYDEEVRFLKSEVDALVNFNAIDRMVLKKIIVNIRNLFQDLVTIEEYFEQNVRRNKTGGTHAHFVSHQQMNPGVVWDNLSLQSSSFRHAIRVTTACSIGFLVAKLFAYGTHSYWILLTIAFILKPAFSLTKQRNVERILGTVGGAAIGAGILYFIPDKTALFIIMVLLMIGTYSFMRINYLLMVICVTPYVFILFTFLGVSFQQVAKERILDTLIGCAIAFSIAYILFPKWEREDLKVYMKQMAEANASYLRKIIEALSGKVVSTLEYKLARRDVYLHSANLSALFQRMLSEPKNKQESETQVQEFVVLNHILFSNIASVATTLLSREPKLYPDELVVLAKKAERKLTEDPKEFESYSVQIPATTGDEVLMKEQLQFIYNVSKDINKLTKAIA